MWAFTHRVDPSVFHFLAALWFIQSWGAEVTEWLHAFAKAPHSCASFSTSCMQSLPVLFLLSYCSMCGWICVCMSQCVSYQRACAAGWHMTQNCGRACAALQQQSAQRAAELSCCRTASLEECMKVFIFIRVHVCVCLCEQCTYRQLAALCWAQRGSSCRRSPHQIGKKLTEKENCTKHCHWQLCLYYVSRGFIHIHTQTHMHTHTQLYLQTA